MATRKDWYEEITGYTMPDGRRFWVVREFMDLFIMPGFSPRHLLVGIEVTGDLNKEEKETILKRELA